MEKYDKVDPQEIIDKLEIIIKNLERKKNVKVNHEEKLEDTSTP